jgi:hypothetical protein
VQASAPITIVPAGRCGTPSQTGYAFNAGTASSWAIGTVLSASCNNAAGYGGSATSITCQSSLLWTTSSGCSCMFTSGNFCISHSIIYDVPRICNVRNRPSSHCSEEIRNNIYYHFIAWMRVTSVCVARYSMSFACNSFRRQVLLLFKRFELWQRGIDILPSRLLDVQRFFFAHV